MIRQYLPVFLVAASTLLASCSSPPQPFGENKLSVSANTYLAQSQSAKTPRNKVDAELNAAQTMIQSNNLNSAEQLMGQLSQAPLTPDEQQQFILLHAAFLMESGKPYECLVALDKIKNPASLNNKAKAYYYQLKMAAYARNNQLGDSLILQLKLSTQPNQVTLFRQLQSLPLKQLNQLSQSYSSNVQLQAWLRLAIIAREYSENTSQLSDALIAWQQNNPTHPAENLLPDQNTLNTLSHTQKPGQIAVLLPLTGPLTSIGKAIQAGILSAYFSTPKAQRDSLRFYDTAQNDIDDIYNTAIENGAQVIIGPLTKNNVEKLADKKNVPLIALNYTDDTNSNMMQFGLSPTQEAQQAANTAWRFGVNRMITITPNSHWGNEVLTAFIQNWQNPDAAITQSLHFKPANMKAQIANLLGIESSSERAEFLRQAIRYTRNQYLQFTPRRRQDFNGFFLASTPPQAKSILPLLKFYFTGQTPVFATSSIYNAAATTNYNQDLNTVYFCDEPLLISKTPAMINQRIRLKQTWPGVYRHNARLFAVGYDSYNLADHFQRLMLLPNFGLQGVSGRLYLNNNHHIFRQLSWARMKNGRPSVLR